MVSHRQYEDTEREQGRAPAVSQNHQQPIPERSLNLAGNVPGVKRVPYCGRVQFGPNPGRDHEAFRETG